MNSVSLGQLRWRCRRGTKELDRILGGYLSNAYASASPELQQAFAALLKEQDPDISDWLMDASKIENPRYAALIEALQQRYL